VGETEPPGPVAYALDDWPTEPEGVGELPDDVMYPLEDAPDELAPGEETG
jgi:hypothetical protein